MMWNVQMTCYIVFVCMYICVMWVLMPLTDDADEFTKAMKL